MGSDSGNGSNPDAEIGKKGSKKTARFDLPPETSKNSGAGEIDGGGEEYVEVTVELINDSIQLLEARPSSPPAKNPREKQTRRNASSRFRQFSEELRWLGRLDRPTGRLDRSKSGTSRALDGLRFIATKTGGKDEWPEASRKFDELTAATNGLLDASKFAKCIDTFEKSTEFAKELFYALARREHIKGDFINKAQFQYFWMHMVDESFDTRLQIFFSMLDKDDDGRITKDEVVEILTLIASTNRLSGIKKKADEFSDLIMEELDPDNTGYISIETLKTLLLEAPREAARTDNSVLTSQRLSQMLKPITQETLMKKWYGKVKYFMMDHWKRVWIIVLWLSVCATLFIYKFVQYKNKDPFKVMGYCLCVAKGAAETLKLNMALILLPVCRNTITWLRNRTGLGAAVPFDDNFTFHQMIAVGIMVGVGLHAGAHLTCDFPRILAVSNEAYENHLSKYFGREQPESYGWFLKGWEGVTGMLMLVLMAVAFTLASPWLRTNKPPSRAPPKAEPKNLPETLFVKTLKMVKTLLTNALQKVKTPLVIKIVQKVKTLLIKILKKVTGFNAFWYSHHTFVIVYALLIVHGFKLYLTTDTWQKTTWMYIAVPITLYACERLTRALRSGIKTVTVQTAVLYEGNVLTLEMSKPQGFKYKSGQYMFLNCPAVSPFEWHPFSITSSPAEEHLSVHIRGLGDWTRQIQKVFSATCHPPADGQSGLRRADGNNTSLPKILIDGAYGAPAQEYIDYDIVLLIGLGIGATPMISIIKDIVHNMNKTTDEETGQALENATSPHTPKKSTDNKSFNTKKAYFYWVAPEQGTFDWFKEIMDEVSEVDRKRVIEMHNHCSSVYEEGDARSALVTMLQTIYRAKNGTDVVAGTRVKSHFAKPVWRQVYKRIAARHPDTTVGVFYCGPPVKELKDLASDFSQKTSTKFEFHKENF